MNTLLSFSVCADDRVKNVLVLLPFLQKSALRHLLVAITSSTAM